MKKIFLGLLFLLVEIKLGRLGITPAWVGYQLILSGTGEVPESETFRTVKFYQAARIYGEAGSE